MGRLFQRLHRENLWDTFYRTEMRLLPLLARMELTGVTLDVASLNSMGRVLAAEAAKIEVEAHSLAVKEFNLASSKQVPYKHRKIRLIEGNAKCRHLKKFTYKGTLRQVLICLWPPPLLVFCLGCSSNFVGSESNLVRYRM